MILNIGLDPVLEKLYYMDKLYPRVETIAEKVSYNMGNKGIISGRILNSLNSNIVLTGFMGGLTGEYILNELKDLGINNEYISIKDETRSTVVLIEHGEIISKITDYGPRITREELGAFYKSYRRLISDSKIIMGLGSLPNGLANEMYYDLIELGNRQENKFILDCTGASLKSGLRASPFIVKLTKEDLEDLTNLELDFETEIIRAGQYVLDKGVKIVIIDLHHKGTIVLQEDKGYRLEISGINLASLKEDLGYLVSGYAYGMEKQYDFETTMRLGQAFKIAYGLEKEISMVDMTDIKRVMAAIEIRTFNY